LYESLTGILFGSEHYSNLVPKLIPNTQQETGQFVLFRKPKFPMILKMFLSSMSVLDEKDGSAPFDFKLLSLLIVLADAVEKNRYEFICKFPVFPYQNNENALQSQDGLNDDIYRLFIQQCSQAAQEYLTTFYKTSASSKSNRCYKDAVTVHAPSVSVSPKFRATLSDCSCDKRSFGSIFSPSGTHFDKMLPFLLPAEDAKQMSSSPLEGLACFKDAGVSEQKILNITLRDMILNCLLK
jgi:hypothetical protein